MRHRLAGGIGPVAVGAIPLLVQLVLVAPALDWYSPGGSDLAGLELDVRNALRGNLLIGTSSRLGVRNLGPVHAYWTAPWYVLGGEGVGGMVVAAWLAQLAAIAVIVLVARSVAGDRTAWFVAFAVALAWLRLGPVSMSDFYNPALTVPVVAAATVVLAAVATARWGLLALAVGLVSAAAQLHFVAAPGLFVLFAGAVVIALQSARPTRRDLVIAVVVFGVLWLPTAVDQFVGTGNVTALADAVRAGPESADQPLGLPSPSPPRGDRAEIAVQAFALTSARAADYGTFVGLSAPYLHGPRQQGPSPVRVVIGAVLIGAVLAWSVAARHRCRLGSLLVWFSCVGALVTYVATARMERGFSLYYLAPIPGYAIALCAAVGVLIASPRRQRVIAPTALVASITALAVGSVFVIAVLDADALTVADLPGPADQDAFVDRVIEGIPPGCPGKTVEIDSPPVQVADVWTLMVAFDRRGYDARVAPNLSRFVGSGHERKGDEKVLVRMPTLAEFNSHVMPPGAVTYPGCGA